MSLTSHIGYGPFQLSSFRPGDYFARSNGDLARVCDPQPSGPPDHILVLTSYDTSNAERIWLHKDAQAYALSEEQAWAIERRQKRGRE